MVTPLLRHLASFAFAAVLLALGGCETVQFGPDTTSPSDTVATEATLLFANKRETDPGALVLLLYPRTASILEDAVPIKEYPAVAFDQSMTFKVAAGRYKVAYRMEGGDLRSMPPTGGEGVDSDWPVATFAAGKSYGLLIETDEGNHTVWRTDIPVASAP